MTIPEAARILGLSRNFGYELARRGEIPVIRFGRRMVVPKAAFERMLGLTFEREVVNERTH
jgi:excisionase family DNA binding protein